MIITRYFAKEVYGTVFAVTLVLILVFLVNQTIRFLSQAATGHLPSGVVLNLILLELPYLLGLLLPLGLYLGLLISYSRLYADQEMTVLFAAGMSHWRLLAMTCWIASAIFVIVCALVFLLNPYLAEKKNAMMTTKTSKNLVAALVPGNFKIIQNGQKVIYVGGISRDHKTAENLFVAQAPALSDQNNGQASWTITSAGSGSQWRDPVNHKLFILAQHGYRYEGAPGERNFQVSQYREYGVEMPEDESLISQDKDAMSSWRLIHNPDHQLRYAVELQWRLALPISVIMLAVLAQLLSRVAPRQGRFQRLLPALLIYIVYANLIFVARSWMAHGQTPEALGLWWTHALMLLFIVFLGVKQKVWR